MISFTKFYNTEQYFNYLDWKLFSYSIVCILKWADQAVSRRIAFLMPHREAAALCYGWESQCFRVAAVLTQCPGCSYSRITAVWSLTQLTSNLPLDNISRQICFPSWNSSKAFSCKGHRVALNLLPWLYLFKFSETSLRMNLQTWRWDAFILSKSLQLLL